MRYKLTANIPGVEVRLAPNPLRARVIFSESAKRELIFKMALKGVLEQAFEAKYYLDQREDKKDEAHKVLKRLINNWLGDEDDDTDALDLELAIKLAGGKEYVDAMIWELAEGEHCGDCTCMAASCMKCHMEMLIDINTLTAGKHVAYKLWSIYLDSPEATAEDKAIEVKRQAIMAEHYKKYPPTPWNPDEATKARIVEENKIAREYYEWHKTQVAAQK